MNPVPRSLPRRTVLAASGTAVLAVAAACSSDPGTAGSATAAATSAAKSSSAAASTGSAAASSKAAAPTTAGTSAAVPAPAGSPVASVAEVEAAGSVVVGTDKPILLCSANGTVVGHTAICTHQGCTVAAAGADANCPCHGSKFNAATGAVITGPAMSALAEVAVTVANGQVYAT
jgi:cytochrome b6-f complex iron-sulfur subunit